MATDKRVDLGKTRICVDDYGTKSFNQSALTSTLIEECSVPSPFIPRFNGVNKTRMTTVGEIKNIADLLEAIRESGLAEKDHAHIRLWFRGQSNSSWALSPGVYRPSFPEKAEWKRLRIERHMSQDFRVQSAGTLTGARDNAALYFLQQHYQMPTRLLDWTHSPLTALHFAVGGSNADTDGQLFMMDAYSLATTQKVPESEFRGVATSRNELFRNALRPIFDWWKPKHFPGFILPVRPDHFDQRVMLQRACFTFHPPGKQALTPLDANPLLSYLIPKSSKLGLQKELFMLGIDAFTIYGDLDSLAARLKFAYKVK
jgi:hypothetical protein